MPRVPGVVSNRVLAFNKSVEFQSPFPFHSAILSPKCRAKVVRLTLGVILGFIIGWFPALRGLSCAFLKFTEYICLKAFTEGHKSQDILKVAKTMDVREFNLFNLQMMGFANGRLSSSWGTQH